MPKRYVLVVGTFALSVLLYVDRICISAAKDPIAGDLSLTDKQFGWILSAFTLGYALKQIPSGSLADRWGPRKLLPGVPLMVHDNWRFQPWYRQIRGIPLASYCD